ncbi:LysR family transcriptional regulator [Actinokineospora auranticolor]|uniref:DNA-binding transcriptional LysR family regulator n=1 Tax=Actinokineospora auranticolor TaxID=155976 RepID=A0A2S6GSY7_9PSEU|nr:LysR family transcriptional regulator [Actinokineospora auranticolor]PPK68320.1 DNA-binding transcriptional LysR family regulator [Actinokineospora auranticolor]
MDLPETRELTYFVAVAEELHFGRAAERLGMTQPPLSRAIRQLERRTGTELFERTSRRVELTPAGAALLDEARVALAAVAAAVRRARRAGQPRRTLTVAMKPGGDGGLLPGLVEAYRAHPDSVPVDVVCRVQERADLVRQGVADLALLHRPGDDFTGLAGEDLVTERQIAVLSADHPLAAARSVRLADLPRPLWPPKHDPNAPAVSDIGQLMQLTAMRRLSAVVPESAAGHLRHDLRAVPVVDAPPTTLVLAWPEHSRCPHTALFVHLATSRSA